MRRLGLLSFLLIAGCASQLPAPDPSACPAPPEATLLLSVQQADKSLPPLVLRWQSEAGPRLIALDTLGSLQFTAALAGSRFQVRAQSYYRGPDPATLTSAVYWWLLRDRLSRDCVAAAGLRLEQQARQSRLWARSRPVWQWRKSKPHTVTLPEHKLTLNIRMNEP